jgi:hypothetical protein
MRAKRISVALYRPEPIYLVKGTAPQKIRDSIRTLAAGKSLAIAMKGGPIDPAN